MIFIEKRITAYKSAKVLIISAKVYKNFYKERAILLY